MKAPSKQQFRAGNPIQTASGNSHLTSAIGTAAGAVDRAANLALSLQKEQEKQDLGEAELEMTRATRRANDAILQNRYSPGEHVEKAAEILQSARAGILNKGKHSAKFRNEMERRTDLFIEGKLAKIGTDAKLMQVENGRTIQLARAKNYRAEGRYDEERAVYDESTGTLWSKEDAEARKMESSRSETRGIYELEADAGNSEFFDDALMPKHEKKRWQDKAITAKKRTSANQMKSAIAEMESKDVFSEEDVIAIVAKYPNMSEEDSTELIKAWNDDQPIDPFLKMDLLDNLNNLHDAYKQGDMTLEEYTLRHSEAALLVYRQGNKLGTGGLRSRAHSLDPAAWNGRNLPQAPESAQSMLVEQVGKTLFDAGSFGNPGNAPRGEDDKLSPAQAVEHLAKQNKAASQRREIEATVKRWLLTEEGKNAGEIEIGQKMREVAAENSVDLVIPPITEPTIEDYSQFVPGTFLPQNSQ